MRTLRIRKFMIFGMLSIVILPWVAYLVVHFIDTGTVQPWGPMQNQKQEASVSQASILLTTNYAKWEEPAWQNATQIELKKLGVEAILLSASGQEIVAFTPKRQWGPSQQISVVENGQQVGVVKLYTHGTNDAVAALCALVVMVLAIFFAAGLQMRRNVITPLEAMSRAAGKIAAGDLDFTLPISHVTEIAEVRTAFYLMVLGLRESFEKQARLEEERRFFIGAIAHDLRTPLFALRGYLDGLEQGLATTPEKMARYVAVCKEKATQLDRLVADLFAFTKLEYLEQTLHKEEVKFADVVKHSVDSLRPVALEKEIEIVEEAPGDVCLVTGDAHLLERALNNLLENALRHTPSRGRILIKWFQEAGRTTVSVRDTGSGFAPQEIDHIFEPLYRGDTARSSVTGGAGLGLTIARRIFKAHGGDLVAANHPDGGAVLTGWVKDRE